MHPQVVGATMQSSLSSSLERLVPEHLLAAEATGQETFKLHIERYDFAKKHISGSKLLDIACGVGYGSRFLHDEGKFDVLGVDISEEAIHYANEHYLSPGVNFHCANAYEFTSNMQYDAVVSLETIEHVPDPQKLIQHLDSFLKVGGTFVGSVPISPTVDANPYHLTDFTEKSFLKLFPKNYVVKAHFYQNQSFQPFRVLAKKETRTADLRKNLAGYYLSHPDKLMLRIAHTLRYGFVSQYLTVAFSKEGETNLGVY